MNSDDSAQFFRELEEKLASAAKLLDEAARLIATHAFDPGRNIRTIGEALSGISDIRLAIYRREPSLKPEFLKD